MSQHLKLLSTDFPSCFTELQTSPQNMQLLVYQWNQLDALLRDKPGQEHERLLRASRLTLATQMAFSCLSFLDRVHGFQGSLSIWMKVRDILWSGARHLRDFSFKRTGILDVMGDEQCHKNVVCTAEVHFSQGFVQRLRPLCRKCVLCSCNRSWKLGNFFKVRKWVQNA